MPILLTEAHRLLVGTRAFLTANKIRRAAIVGSDAVVFERIKDSLMDDPGVLASRRRRGDQEFTRSGKGCSAGRRADRRVPANGNCRSS